jgi:hypothetical protein
LSTTQLLEASWLWSYIEPWSNGTRAALKCPRSTAPELLKFLLY